MARYVADTSGRIAKLFFCIACLLVVAPDFASAQITTANISGTVRDESSAVLPGVTVTLTNQNTGISRTVVSDAEGRYQAPNLPFGNYEVRAELSGFRTAVHRDVEVSLGRHPVVDVSMHVGEIAEEVVVTGEVPLVDTQNSMLTGVVEEVQVRELPLNLRSYEQLATLQPGVTPSSAGARVGVRGGAGTQLYISGARSEYNEFQIDNVEAGDVWGKTPGGMSGGVLGVEGVKEFSVMTSSFSAEYGKAAGGVINVITRSGSNRFDGSAYLFHRNEALDASNFFDREEKPEFLRNQFGGAMGGPVLKDKTFFFANYEGLRQDLPNNETSQVPTAEARLGILPGRTVQVVDAVKPYLALWPLPNGRDLGDGTADFHSVTNQRTVSDYFLTRVDHQLAQSHSLTGRYIWEDGNRTSPNAVLLEKQTGVLEGKKQNLSLQYQTIVSPRMVNEVRFGHNQSEQNDYDVFEGIPESLNFINRPGRVLGNLNVTGLESYGHSGSQPLFFKYKSFQFINHLTWTPGRHSFRAGADIRRFHIDAMNVAALHGNYRFNSLELFLRGQSRDFIFLLPGQGREEPFNIRQMLFGFYAQDDFKWRENFTLNMGVRYEFITVPTENNGKVANLRDPMDARTTIGEPMFENPSLKNIAPRLGFAWSPGGSGRTSVRGGFGVFFNQIGPSYLTNTVFRIPPFFVRPTVSSAVFPNQYELTVAGRDLETLDVYALGEAFGFNFLDYTPDNPYMLQYQISLQREFFSDTVVTAAYVGSSGRHLNRVADVNTPVPTIIDGRATYPASGVRPNPVFDSLPMQVFDATSQYHSLQTSVRKRFSKGLMYQVSYTFGQSMDDSSGSSAGGDAFDSSNTHTMLFNDRSYDRGHSQFDITHAFSTSGVWELPFGRGKRFGSGMSGVSEALLGSWQLSGTLYMRSGTHASVYLSADRANNRSAQFFGQRPDLVPGADPNPINPGNPNQYIDPSAFAPPPRFTLGNLPRGTITMPGVVTVDMSLTKSFDLPGDARVQFRGEVFNLLNRANFDTPSLTVFAGTAAAPTLSPTFGRITETSTPARQIQLGLKVIF